MIKEHVKLLIFCIDDQKFVVNLNYFCLSFLFYHEVLLHWRIHWRLPTTLETSCKSVWSNGFSYVKVFIFCKWIPYTIHWDKTQILKKFCSDKIIGTKNTLFFLSQVLTHQSFTFNFQFLYQLNHKAHHSKVVCGVFQFLIPFRL